MVTVIPEGGLCNRMRVVASAWLLAQDAAQPMQVLWYRTPDFNARFDELFVSEGLPFRVRERSAMFRVQRAGWRLREAVWRLAGRTVIGPSDTVPRAFDAAELRRRLRGRRALIRTNTRLDARPGMFRMFRPAPVLAAQLDVLGRRLALSVGVHVRRADNAKATAVSTLDSFLALMRDEARADPEVQFFVATDSIDALHGLRAALGERVWEHPKRAYARDDPAALGDAVIDLYALARCRKLLGSYWSSFTDTAADLCGIECVVAGAPG